MSDRNAHMADILRHIMGPQQVVTFESETTLWIEKRRRPRKPTPDGLVLPPEAANKLNVTVEQLFGFVRDGDLRYINIGRGSKRPRYAFTDADIQQLIEKRQTREATCPSTNPKSRRRISGTISKSIVVGFTARREQQLAAKRKR